MSDSIDTTKAEMENIRASVRYLVWTKSEDPVSDIHNAIAELQWLDQEEVLATINKLLGLCAFEPVDELGDDMTQAVLAANLVGEIVGSAKVGRFADMAESVPTQAEVDRLKKVSRAARDLTQQLTKLGGADGATRGGRFFAFLMSERGDPWWGPDSHFELLVTLRLMVEAIESEELVAQSAATRRAFSPSAALTQAARVFEEVVATHAASRPVYFADAKLDVKLEHRTSPMAQWKESEQREYHVALRDYVKTQRKAFVYAWMSLWGVVPADKTYQKHVGAAHDGSS